MKEKKLKEKLIKLVNKINKKNQKHKISFHQQNKLIKKMSLYGANGRLGIHLTKFGYDLTLSGKSLEKTFSSKLKKHFKRECDGYKQRNNKISQKKEPFWRTEKFDDVKKVAKLYAKTSK